MIKIAVFETTSLSGCKEMNDFIDKNVDSLISVHTSATSTEYSSRNYVTIVYYPVPEDSNDTSH
jgi:hypothetical protein